MERRGKEETTPQDTQEMRIRMRERAADEKDSSVSRHLHASEHVSGGISLPSRTSPNALYHLHHSVDSSLPHYPALILPSADLSSAVVWSRWSGSWSSHGL